MGRLRLHFLSFLDFFRFPLYIYLPPGSSLFDKGLDLIHLLLPQTPLFCLFHFFLGGDILKGFYGARDVSPVVF